MPNSTLLPFESHVFINCPFDDDYKLLFRALVFAIHDCGFVARCALEDVGAEETRLAKLLRIISECKYGIHDISRVELGMTNNLPRFNMPFESGLFWGCLSYGKKGQRGKKIMILDSIPFRYQQTLSDIAGQDIKVHNDDPKQVVDIVRTWLGNKTLKILPGGEEMWKHYQEFEKDLPTICANLHITPDEIISSSYFTTYISVIVTWLKSKNYSL
jgi:hypothetical protein